MPGTFGKNLQMCFTNIMYPPSSSSSTQSPIQEQTQENNNQNPSNISSILIKNFNSHDPNIYNHATTLSTSNMPPPSPQPDDTDTTTPDFATVYKSKRFFFSSPGHSNSITESATSSLSSSSCSSSFPERDNGGVVDGGVPIPTLSPDPFLDFRRSMQEMVEARDLVDVRDNWEYLHDLLTCYLSLNPKSTHKFIVRAFADLLVSLMTSSPVEGSSRNAGGCSEK
ncbi:Transcription repressor [Heracleum sosnowskyi]|uniref:Transcription repressor n=1 Tax=Heracleum sosnowskyi TaxID=360622 RepID=A0AAD8J8X2_9APIA|nr:Transcription repressor [Heracleum sosnowskyi]